MDELFPGLHRFRDTCNVYLLLRDQRALLVDFGDGDILEETDVGSIDCVLHTHYHRDMCQGDWKLPGTVQVIVPRGELSYFSGVETFWRDKEFFVNYDMRNEFFALRRSIRVARAVAQGDEIEWRGLKLSVLDTPVHSEGSVSFLTEFEGKRVLFCGDLIYGNGKLWTFHDLEWDYCNVTGLRTAIDTVARLEELDLDLLLPAHGEPILRPKEALATLQQRLRKALDLLDWHSGSQTRTRVEPYRVTSHIAVVGSTTSALILSDSGHALVCDWGYVPNGTLRDLKAQFNIKRINAVFFSHYHDDHIAQSNELRETEGAELWAYEGMVDILASPRHYNLPCLWREPIRVDRVLRDGERILWQGLDLRFYHLPGQTRYAMGLFLEDDGKRILLTGDNIPAPTPGGILRGQFCSRNRQEFGGGYLQSAKKMLELEPQLLIGSHWEPCQVTREDLERHLNWARDTEKVLKDLIGQPDPAFGIDPTWASFCPYQVAVQPGESFQVELRIRNHLRKEAPFSASIRIPRDWSALPTSVKTVLEPRSETSIRFILTTAPYPYPRAVYTADIRLNNIRFGELPEGIVNFVSRH